MEQYHEAAAIFIARIFLGCLFFFQGFDAVFKVKIQNAIQTYQNTFPNNTLPKFLIIYAAWFTSCSALICGPLLIAGFLEYPALYILGINLIITSIGFGINSPMWDTKFVFPRLALLILLLISPPAWNVWSLDNLFFPQFTPIR